MAINRNSAEPVCVAIFARPPIAGAAKTRLIPTLGAEGAARLHRRLALHAVRTAVAANLGPVTLWSSNDANHRFFRAMSRAFGIRIQAQRGDDLGERMFNAFNHHLPTAPTLLTGSDIPSLCVADLRTARTTLLAGFDAHLIGVADGGYGLIGLRSRLSGELFSEMPWGTAQVLQETRRRLSRLGWSWREGAERWDVDRPTDLLLLARDHPELL